MSADWSRKRPEVELAAHDYDRPGKPDCAWNDLQGKQALVSGLVNDALAMLRRSPIWSWTTSRPRRWRCWRWSWEIRPTAAERPARHSGPDPPHPAHQRYVPTPKGIRVVVFYTKLHNRPLGPLLAADRPPAPLELREALRVIDRQVNGYVQHARMGSPQEMNLPQPLKNPATKET